MIAASISAYQTKHRAAKRVHRKTVSLTQFCGREMKKLRVATLYDRSAARLNLVSAKSTKLYTPLWPICYVRIASPLFFTFFLFVFLCPTPSPTFFCYSLAAAWRFAENAICLSVAPPCRPAKSYADGEKFALVYLNSKTSGTKMVLLAAREFHFYLFFLPKVVYDDSRARATIARFRNFARQRSWCLTILSISCTPPSSDILRVVRTINAQLTIT